jgi:FkbM family methyltransferase
MRFVKKLVVTLNGVGKHPLNRHAKWKAMWNFCVAQVAVRLVPGDVCVPFPNQTKLLVPPRMKGAAHFISPGLCEFEDMCFVLHFLTPEDLFVDVGANIGAYTVLASGVAGAKTMAFEPSPFNYQYLVQNVRLNGLTAKATPLNLAVGSEEGVLRLTEGLGTENYIAQDHGAGQTVETKVTTLDQALADLRPALMKMDVEGFETKAVEGARHTLDHPSLEAFIIERAGNAQRYGFDEAALHRRLQEMAFIPCAYSPSERALRKISADVVGNIIYVKNVAAVQARLKRSPGYHYANGTL